MLMYNLYIIRSILRSLSVRATIFPLLSFNGNNFSWKKQVDPDTHQPV
ncbi:predicted protein [Sclerotinia sclerotiorum 1980 UF-70]|uniref:Uncharacterized protein n=1 Tax=Sclerotinia sclerotiorum (strain ATCC 18683 / 1980 / Ss-1) TaxID=665079 RepID=A7E463_SCLS1|nr:predicted protein [Sclerotinia sclerotiorum 1980 UF-70]EDN90685.1 predicted protein [Sclerotinia sclerotiorum 1980 UF-70]